MPIAQVLTTLSLSLVASLPAQTPTLTVEELATFTLPGGAIMAAAFSPDGRLLATGGELGDLMLREVGTGKVRWRVAPSDIGIRTLAFSPDGALLACEGRRLTLHRVDGGEERWRCADASTETFAWNDAGTRFAFSYGCVIAVRDVAPGTEVARHRLEHRIRVLRFDAGDAFLSVRDEIGGRWRLPVGAGAPQKVPGPDAPEGGAITLHESVQVDGTSKVTLRRGDAEFPVPGRAFALAVTRDEKAFAVGSDVGTVRWWTRAGTEVSDVQLGGQIAALAFSPDGGTLCVSTYDGRLALHRAGAAPVALHGHDDAIRDTAIRDMALSPDGSVVAMCGARGVLQPVDGSPAHTLVGRVWVGSGRHGTEILVASGDDDCRVVDGRTGAVVAAVRVRRTNERERPTLGPGNRVVRSFPPGAVDLGTGAVLAFPKGVLLLSVDPVAARSPAGTWAVAWASGHASEDGGLLVTDADGKPLLQEQRGPVPAMSFSPDGSRLAYCCGEFGMPPSLRNYRLRVLDGHTLKRLREFPLDVRWLRFLDARLALVADEQGLAVLDTDTGDLVQRLAGLGRYGFELSEDCGTLAWNDGRAVRLYRLTRP